MAKTVCVSVVYIATHVPFGDESFHMNYLTSLYTQNKSGRFTYNCLTYVCTSF